MIPLQSKSDYSKKKEKWNETINANQMSSAIFMILDCVDLNLLPCFIYSNPYFRCLVLIQNEEKMKKKLSKSIGFCGGAGASASAGCLCNDCEWIHHLNRTIHFISFKRWNNKCQKTVQELVQKAVQLCSCALRFHVISTLFWAVKCFRVWYSK